VGLDKNVKLIKEPHIWCEKLETLNIAHSTQSKPENPNTKLESFCSSHAQFFVLWKKLWHNECNSFAVFEI